MSVPVQTPEILQILNHVIVNIVSSLERYTPYYLWLALAMFCIWLIYQMGVLFRDLILKNG